MSDSPTHEHEPGDAAPADELSAEVLALIQAEAEPAGVPDRGLGRRRGPGRDEGSLRVIIVLWCFWLLGAWAVAWLSDTSVPRVRWMLFAGSLGLMLVWPAFRLSERVRAGSRVEAVAVPWLDWLAMVSVYQAVIWSLYLIAAWPLTRGLWLDAAILAWSLLSALIVATARLWPGAAARSVGMLACIALVFAEPVAIWLSLRSGGAGWAMQISPIQTMWELTDASRTNRVSPWDQHVVLIGLTAVVGWIALAGWFALERLLGKRARPGQTPG